MLKYMRALLRGDRLQSAVYDDGGCRQAIGWCTKYKQPGYILARRLTWCTTAAATRRSSQQLTPIIPRTHKLQQNSVSLLVCRSASLECANFKAQNVIISCVLLIYGNFVQQCIEMFFRCQTSSMKTSIAQYAELGHFQ